MECGLSYNERNLKLGLFTATANNKFRGWRLIGIALLVVVVLQVTTNLVDLRLIYKRSSIQQKAPIHAKLCTALEVHNTLGLIWIYLIKTHIRTDVHSVIYVHSLHIHVMSCIVTPGRFRSRSTLATYNHLHQCLTDLLSIIIFCLWNILSLQHNLLSYLWITLWNHMIFLAQIEKKSSLATFGETCFISWALICKWVRHTILKPMDRVRELISA